jgi:hypothetical protein
VSEPDGDVTVPVKSRRPRPFFSPQLTSAAGAVPVPAADDLARTVIEAGDARLRAMIDASPAAAEIRAILAGVHTTRP